MSGRSDNTSERGIGGATGWLLGGLVGGVAGGLAFGAFMWMLDPDLLAVSIPGLYGLESGSAIGWALHLVHGAILGLLFGFVVTRRQIMGVLTASLETDALAATGMWIRTAVAGLTYGIAVWAILPVAVLPVLFELADQVGAFPGIGSTTMIGHAIYGIVLGAVFGAMVSEPTERADQPFEDASASSGER